MTDENTDQSFSNDTDFISYFEYYENDWVWAYNGDSRYVLGTGNLACELELEFTEDTDNLTAKRYSTIPV